MGNLNNMVDIEGYVGEVGLTYKVEGSKLDLGTVIGSIAGSNSATEYLRQIWEDDIDIRERFKVVFLNNKNTIRGYFEVSVGGVTETIVDTRLIATAALLTGSIAVILAHNHPSGKAHPSQADKNVTKRVKAALSLLDIKLIDHIILTSNKSFSFCDENIMP